METMAERLRRAREAKGIPSARQAAQQLRIPVSTYSAHENGQNDYGPDEADVYGRAFGKAPGWLLTGKGSETPEKLKAEPKAPAVSLMGHASAGAELYFEPAGHLGYVEIPEAGPNTVAVEIRGISMGRILDRAIVIYDDVRRPLTSDLYGKLCVVGLEEGGVYIKKVQPSRVKGRAHLYSENEDPILDAKVAWAAKVRQIIFR